MFQYGMESDDNYGGGMDTVVDDDYSNYSPETRVLRKYMREDNTISSDEVSQLDIFNYITFPIARTYRKEMLDISIEYDFKDILEKTWSCRWPQYNDQTVTITGKYNDDGQSDGYNDHATRYNTAISKVVEIQDTYGGQTVACFLPGSKVSTPSGDKNIEDLDIGDEVNTFNIQTLPDEDLGYKEWSTWTTSSIDGFESSTAVIDNYYFDYASHYHTIFGVSNTTGLNVQLDVTGEHELLIKDTDNVWKWMKAGNCKVGQFLLGEDKSEIIIDQITRVEGEVEVVNIDVEPSDVYLVNGVLVHNKGTNDAP
jgi:hypothetical protein